MTPTPPPSNNLLDIIPDPRMNIGNQAQHSRASIGYYKWHYAHNNTKAALIAIGPNVLYCLTNIIFGILIAILQDSDGGGVFDELFAIIFAGQIILIWLFTSFIVTIISTVAAFIKQCPELWMIIGPGLGFLTSFLMLVMAISIIVEDISFSDIMEDFLFGLDGFALLCIGFVCHLFLAFATMRLMVIATRGENN